ncbi:thiamine-phosphate kinase [Micromonospora inyonensis]|uniref:Thiamine-monophosphate kinase n=1 Tax=Micromonospora inyonensis TaxID=47866 RepID=A0A1C6RT20_9ACTN|nr:thiamine-phosphate kinase [Micromonospora inyonensis]SCL20279.1 thiamine-phosphate kinase [Micromonospora inyonensis]
MSEHSGAERSNGDAGNDRSVVGSGEFGLIDRVTARLPYGSACLLGPGDDAALVAAPDRRVVASTDVLVEGRHFRRDWSSAVDVGHRAAAANLADIAAMGATPTALLVALCLPPGLDVAWAEGLADGLAAEAGRVGAGVVGGDMSASPTLTVAVTALGDLGGRPPVLRSGARPGDVLALAGRIGYAAAGYTVLSRGFRTPKLLVEAYRRPEVPYPAGPYAARLGATAMIDVSDGLLADLGHVARASGVAVDVRRDAFEVPRQMADAAQALGVDPYTWILGGGDDHALAATFPPAVVLPPPWRVVGRVAEGSGVTVDGEPWDGPAGWDHFR